MFFFIFSSSASLQHTFQMKWRCVFLPVYVYTAQATGTMRSFRYSYFFRVSHGAWSLRIIGLYSLIRCNARCRVHRRYDSRHSANLTLLLSLVLGGSEEIVTCIHWRQCRGQVNSECWYVQQSEVLSCGSFLPKKLIIRICTRNIAKFTSWGHGIVPWICW